MFKEWPSSISNSWNACFDGRQKTQPPLLTQRPSIMSSESTGVPSRFQPTKTKSSWKCAQYRELFACGAYLVSNVSNTFLMLQEQLKNFNHSTQKGWPPSLFLQLCPWMPWPTSHLEDTPMRTIRTQTALKQRGSGHGHHWMLYAYCDVDISSAATVKPSYLWHEMLHMM